MESALRLLSALVQRVSLVHLKARRVNADIVGYLEEVLAMAKAGDITEMVLVSGGASNDVPVFKSFVDFDDSWRILGALAYAQAATLRAAGFV